MHNGSGARPADHLHQVHGEPDQEPRHRAQEGYGTRSQGREERQNRGRHEGARPQGTRESHRDGQDDPRCRPGNQRTGAIKPFLVEDF